MSDLEQAIVKTIANGLMTAGYHDAADYVLSDWMALAISRANKLRAEIAARETGGDA